MSKTALVFGASGLVGDRLLTLLLEDARYDKVVVVGRQVLAHEHPKLVQHVMPLTELYSWHVDAAIDDVFC